MHCIADTHVRTPEVCRGWTLLVARASDMNDCRSELGLEVASGASACACRCALAGAYVRMKLQGAKPIFWAFFVSAGFLAGPCGPAWSLPCSPV